MIALQSQWCSARLVHDTIMTVTVIVFYSFVMEYL